MHPAAAAALAPAPYEWDDDEDGSTYGVLPPFAMKPCNPVLAVVDSGGGGGTSDGASLDPQVAAAEADPQAAAAEAAAAAVGLDKFRDEPSISCAFEFVFPLRLPPGSNQDNIS